MGFMLHVDIIFAVADVVEVAKAMELVVEFSARATMSTLQNGACFNRSFPHIHYSSLFSVSTHRKSL